MVQNLCWFCQTGQIGSTARTKTCVLANQPNVHSGSQKITFWQQLINNLGSLKYWRSTLNIARVFERRKKHKKSMKVTTQKGLKINAKFEKCGRNKYFCKIVLLYTIRNSFVVIENFHVEFSSSLKNMAKNARSTSAPTV